MNYRTPEFEMEGNNYPNPNSSGTPSSSQPNKPYTGDEDILELIWNNGQPVGQTLPRQQQQIFMHEDEMSSWIQYPLVEDSPSFDHNFCADLLYPPPPSSLHTTSTTTVSESVAIATVPVRTTHVSFSEPKPPAASTGSTGRGFLGKQLMPPPGGPESEPSVQNCGLFARYKEITEGAGPSSSKAAAPLVDTVVDSSDTPLIEMEAAKQRGDEGGNNIVSGFVTARGSSSGGEKALDETIAVLSSPGGSSASGAQGLKQPVEDRKRKGVEVEEAEEQSEDVESESADTKKQARGSTSKRSRATEVHNLSERRRRDRINEKMRALQELVPRCNKSDKASMLDEAIEYLKSLQMQVQMMSMGYGMVPMMYPGIQQYVPPMGMSLGMGMNMEMGMNRPMMSYPYPSSAFPTSGASAHMGPRYPVPLSPFHMPPTPVQDSLRFQTSQPDPILTTGGAPNPHPPRVPLYTDPYQKYHGVPQMQLTLQQNQVMARPITSKPGASRGAENVNNPKSG